MGSGASKTAKETSAAAQRAVQSAMSHRSPPTAAATPPLMERGFRRGEDGVATPQEESQERYLQAKNATAPTELPKDLLDFLQDAGPLEKRMDPKLTSSRLVEEWEKEERKSGEDATTHMRDRLDAQERGMRSRRRMPLVQGLGFEGDQADSQNKASEAEAMWQEVHVTTRTTNFSDAPTDQQDEDPLDLRFSSWQMFQFLQPSTAFATTSNKDSNLDAAADDDDDTANTEDTASRFHAAGLLHQRHKDATHRGDNDKDHHARVDTLLQGWKQRVASAGLPLSADEEESMRRTVSHMLQYTQVPTLMYDSDQTSLVGVSPERVPLLLLQKLQPVPTHQVQWTLSLMQGEEKDAANKRERSPQQSSEMTQTQSRG